MFDLFFSCHGQPGCVEFEEMDWFATVVSYGGDDMADNDEDANLLPDVMRRTLVPKLVGMQCIVMSCNVFVALSVQVYL